VETSTRQVAAQCEPLTMARAKALATSQILREMAEDYLHLAADADGKVDGMRKRNYKWLVKLAERLRAEEKKQKQGSI
jgi:hypothetical protein